MPSRRLDQVDDVAANRRRDVNELRLPHHLGDRRRVRDGPDVVEGGPGPLGRQDVGLDLGRGISDRESQHEPVQLGLGQRISALVLDRILRRDDHERRAQLVGLRVDRHLPLLHALEQRRLRLRARPVDLIGEHDVGEDRAGTEFEVAPLLIEDVDAGDIAGKQIGGELNAPEGAVHRPRDGLGEHRLADAGYVLDEHVTLRHQPHEGQPNLPALALDDAFDVRLDPFEALREQLPFRGVFDCLHVTSRPGVAPSYRRAAKNGPPDLPATRRPGSSTPRARQRRAARCILCVEMA
jgi:hypothetical protein